MNENLECGFEGYIFSYYFTEIFLFLFEGMSMGIMMLFHFINFKQGNPILSHDDKMSIIIRREEFDTEEVITT